MRLAWRFFKAAMCIEHDVRSEPRIGAQSQFVQSERPRDFVGTVEQQAASAPPCRCGKHGRIFDQQMRKASG
jgi:hypothetical protein